MALNTICWRVKCRWGNPGDFLGAKFSLTCVLKRLPEKDYSLEHRRKTPAGEPRMLKGWGTPCTSPLERGVVLGLAGAK